MAGFASQRFEAFRWELLQDAAMEDWQGLWEPLHCALNVLGDLPREDQIGAAERAMRELFAEELIFFVDQGDWPGQPWQDRILSSTEVDAAIASSAWRSIPLADDVTVWFAGTEAGKAAVLDHWANIKASRTEKSSGSE